MKRSIFYLICAVAVGGAACQKLPEASTPSSDANPTPTPAATATPPPVGERLEPLHVPPHPSQQQQPAQDRPDIPLSPGGGSFQQGPAGGGSVVPPHRKPPVAAKMEV